MYNELARRILLPLLFLDAAAAEWRYVSQSGQRRLDALGSASLIGQDPVMAKPALDLSSLTSDEKLELIDDFVGKPKARGFRAHPSATG
jgi:hypothetical protein